MIDNVREREFYRRQSDELGSQPLRLQQDLVRVRRDSRRNRTTATLVRELYHLAHDDVVPAEVGSWCLRIVMDRLAVDCAAILVRVPEVEGYRAECSLGFSDEAITSIEQTRPPSLGLAPNPRGLPDAPAALFRKVSGLTSLLWADAADGQFLLLIGNTRADRLRAGHFDEGDQESLLVALEVYVNITELKQAQSALRASETRYRAIVNSVSDAIVVADLSDGRILDANQRVAELFGYDLGALQRCTKADLNPDDPLFGGEAGQHILQRALRGVSQRFEWQMQRPGGDTFWTEVRLRCADIGGNERLLIVIRDITERRRAEEQLRHDGLHDALTGLANRALVMNRVEQALAKRERQASYGFALFYIDLDRFKMVNDSLGHNVGDQLLVAMARRLQGCVRPGDTIARLGGDEFVILLDELHGESEANDFAGRLQFELMKPLQVGGVEISPSASLGVAVSGDAYRRWDEMLRDADLAMYEAKAAGKAQYRVFHPSMHRKAVDRIQLENELRNAIAADELCLHYQPLVAMKDGAVIGFEALVRWQHPQRGLIMPGEFIPMAEESGLIASLGRWVLREACRQIVAWRRDFPDHPALTMSVNLSRQQLTPVGLPDQVRTILEETGCDPANLCLEITESAIMENVLLARAALDGLRAMGIRLSMDDFGTGYSSLSFLHQFPIDVLKFDRSFVRQMASEQNGRQIVATIVTLGHSLDMRVVPEGVETGAAAGSLREMGCDIGQGYLLARPLPQAEADALLRGDTMLSVP